MVELFLLFLAEFLEAWIGAQRIPERIEPKKRWRDGRWAVSHPQSLYGVSSSCVRVETATALLAEHRLN